MDVWAFPYWTKKEREFLLKYISESDIIHEEKCTIYTAPNIFKKNTVTKIRKRIAASCPHLTYLYNTKGKDGTECLF